MKTFAFGPLARPLSRIALGTWPMDGRDWGDANDDTSIATVHAALELGINLFDTAPVYGPERCETVLGKGLAGTPREEVFIASKVGIRWNEVHLYQDLSYSSVKEECEQSLRRLGTDYIDLLQIHWPHAESPLEDTLRALVDLEEEGKIRHIGLSNFTVPLLEQARGLAPIACLQPPYHLFFRGIEAEILPYCIEHGIPTLVYGPLCKGMLTGKFGRREIPDDIRRKDPFFGAEVLPALLTVTESLAEIAARENLPLVQLVLGATLARPGITAAIVGARSPQQIRESAPAGALELEARVLDEVRRCVETAPHVV